MPEVISPVKVLLLFLCESRGAGLSMGVLRAMAAVRQFAANSLSEPTFPSEQLQQLADAARSREKGRTERPFADHSHAAAQRPRTKNLFAMQHFRVFNRQISTLYTRYRLLASALSPQRYCEWATRGMLVIDFWSWARPVRRRAGPGAEQR